MNKAIFSMMIFFIMSVMVGCMPRPLEPDAKNVTVLYGHDTHISGMCQFLGKISGKDVHGMKLQFSWGLEKNLKLDDINFLKNEGEKLNANVVVFKKHQTLIQRYHVSPGRHTDISIHSIEGSAYRCPSQKMSTIKRLNTMNHCVYEKPVVIESDS